VTERAPVAAAWLAVGALIAIALYVAAFRGVDVGNLGWDAAGSVVQMRAASQGVLDLPGARPGVGVVGAFVAGTGLAPVGATPIELSIAAVASLGLAAAAGLRRTWDVPAWGLGVAVLMVAAWGGTARLAAGYLANLLSLVPFLLGTVLALSPERTWWAVGAAFAAALLAHPGLFPAYAAILVGWVILELARDRGRRELGSMRVLGAFLVASLAVAAVVVGVLGLSPDDLQDLALARERFDERAAELLTWIDPLLTVAMIVVGAIVLVASRDRRRSGAALRLGIAWLAVSAGGIVVLALAPQIPGHRTLLLGVPAPMLGTLGLVGATGWLTDRLERRGPGWRAAAFVAAGALAVAIALVALGPFEARASRPSGALGPGPNVVAGYLHAADPRRPVVLVMDPSDGPGLLTWKARLNAVRALAPDPLLLHVVLYVGDERALLAERPTRRSGDARFEAISARTWPSVHAVLDQDPVVLAVRPWVTPEAWARIADGSPVVGDEVAVIRGPVPPGEIPQVRSVRVPIVDAAVRIAILLVLLGLLGGGWSAATLGAGAAPDAIALAPAAGLAAVTLVGTGVAIAGGDPGGAPGLTAVGVAAAAGWFLAWRARAAAET
jgi:hypothetical protein